ncbi:MAG: diadenylate cyclase CdaA [Candidatus Omnitrophica bacterium]|nr:diadenylate cyclase CdaA [Candidatus Omnitrophota bacterium]
MLEELFSKITLNWRIILEITILWFVFYRVLLFLKDTKAVYVIRGIFILIVAFFVFQKLKLNSLNWILTKIFALSVISLMIIFQPELRQGLTRLGQQPLLYAGFQEEEIENIVKEVSSAVSILAKKRVGALLAIQRQIGLKNYVESGVPLDAQISSEFIQSIFMPDSPLHDGGLILVGERIAAAACLFPLSENPDIDKALGMRHRAGIGLSEETDALVIIVSEERSNISLAINGRITPDLKKEDLITILKGLLKKGRKR